MSKLIARLWCWWDNTCWKCGKAKYRNADNCACRQEVMEVKRKRMVEAAQ